MIRLIPAHSRITIFNDSASPVVDTTYQVGSGAYLTVLHEETDTASRAHTLILEQGATVDYAMLVQGQSCDVTIKIVLAGAYAQARVRIMSAGTSDQSHTIKTIQQHDARSTSSDLYVKTLVAESAQTHYRGIIVINNVASEAVAIQRATAILLGNHARATAMPSLEVSTNDVRCTHGSAIGQFDQQQLLYLCSRGMDSESAKRVLIEGFFADIVHSIPPEIEQRWIERALSIALGDYEKNNGSFSDSCHEQRRVSPHIS